MKYKAILFDLDQTLIDSSLLEKYRTSRNWSKVMANLHLVTQKQEIRELLLHLAKKSVKIVVITNSPKMYAEAILKRLEIPYDILIAFHDVKYRKPHPEPFLKALNILGIPSMECLSVGDHDNDIIASRSANITAIAVNWYSPNYSFGCNPEVIVSQVQDLIKQLN